jgi:hypothetical protein
VNKELEKICKETVVRHCPGIFLKGLKRAMKISVRIKSDLTEHIYPSILNTSQKCCHLSHIGPVSCFRIVFSLIILL